MGKYSPIHAKPILLYILFIPILLLAACEKSDKSSTATIDSPTPTNQASDPLKTSKTTQAPAYPNQVYFGDTHLHTSLSMDAGTFGNRLGLEPAYQFSRGEQITSSTGLTAKLARPLDFVVIADHSDGMGFFDMFLSADPKMMEKDEGKRWNKAINEGGEAATKAALEIITLFANNKFPWKTNDPVLMKPVWNSVIDAAEKYNEPGKFTAFIGYEWTSLVKGNNLHRVVVYRDNAKKARQTIPFTLADSADPEDLWKAMQSYETKTGGKLLAIAHNGNLSNGLMFDLKTLSGNEFTKEYAQQRLRWEPLYEATQIKGDGEAHPFLSPDDEFADYETWDLGNLDMSQLKQDSMLAGEYARSGLKRGLEVEQKLGVNPFKFGMIGSTDSHTSLATADENNFFGKHSGVEPSAERASHVVIGNEKNKIYGYQMASSGYAAVWAKENTRASLYDAMKRRETYATTGSRMKVRFFGGWNYSLEDTKNPKLLVKNGYEKGVPMGGDLRSAPQGKSPTFILSAMKDVVGGNLDRIQIIKGWIDKEGKTQERIFDVAVSDDRKIDANGRCKTPVGNTVNVKKATWSNTIGDAALNTVWTDPNFDPKQRAFYYARVIEIPTPRWTAYDAKNYRAKIPKASKMMTQERAYTSPIWYNPA